MKTAILRAAAAGLFACSSLVSTASAAPISVRDHRGQDIQVDAPATRVAIFPLPIPEAMIAVDGGIEHIAGINPLARSTLMNSVIGQLYPGIANIDTSLVSRDFVPNVEELSRARPDVVIQWDFNLDTVVAPMENAGLKVVTVGSENREARRAYVAMLGQILGKQERAQSLLDWDDQTLAELAAQLSDVPLESRPRIVFIDGMNGNELTVFGTQQVYFDAGGLINAATDAGFTRGSVNVGAEAVLSWNPDIVLVNYYNTTITPDDILLHPVLAALPAVQQGRVYKTPAIDPATAAGGEMVYQWLAKIGYPDRFDTDMRAVIADGFQRLYGATLTDAQIDALLQMDWNRSSAGYGTGFAAAP